MTPVVRHSPLPYRAVVAIGLVCVVALVAFGEPAVAALCLVLVALFALGARKRLRGGGPPALTRDGDRLVGTALRQPLPVAGTTFAIVSDHQGSWLIELHSGGGERVTLSAGGWHVDGEGRVTKARTPDLLRRLGLSARD